VKAAAHAIRCHEGTRQRRRPPVSLISAEANVRSEVNILSLEKELKRTLRRLNVLMIVLAVELIPIALVAVYFLVMMLSAGSGTSD